MRYFLRLKKGEAEVEVDRDVYRFAIACHEASQGEILFGREEPEPLPLSRPEFPWGLETDPPGPSVRETLELAWVVNDPEVLLASAFLQDLNYAGAGLA